MKVAFVWWTMGPYHIARMNALSRIESIELTVFEIAPFDDHFWEISEKGSVQFNHVLVTNRTLNILTKLLGTIKLATRYNLGSFDMIIDGMGYSNLLSIILRKLYNNFVLWSESTLLDNDRSKIKDGLISSLVKNFKGAIVAGTRHAEMLTYFGMPKEFIFQVGNVIGNEYFLKERNRISSSIRILFVGRLLEIKNTAFLIDAYKTMIKQNPQLENVELVIVGSGEEELNLRKKAADSPHIYFLGSLQPSQLREEYQNASFFVLPSMSEPWGLVVNEAMASGLPVLVSQNCGCVPELVKEGMNGYTFAPTDSRDLVDKLTSFCLMEENERIKMGVKSEEIIRSFSPQEYAMNVEKALQQIATK